MPKNTIKCPKCGYSIPKKDIEPSGWDSQSSVRHIHCPNCRKKLAYNP